LQKDLLLFDINELKFCKIEDIEKRFNNTLTILISSKIYGIFSKRGTSHKIKKQIKMGEYIISANLLEP
jgi:hypothetical protein